MNIKKKDLTIAMVTIAFIICEGCIIYAIPENKVVGMLSAFMVFVYATLMTKVTKVTSFELDIDDGEISVNQSGQSKDQPKEPKKGGGDEVP